MATLVSVIFSVCFYLSPTTAVSSPHSIGSDLTILTHNDLYGPTSPRQAAVITLSTPRSYSDAQSSCARLGESLWSPGNRSQDLGFLRYLDYGRATDGLGTYWISSTSEDQAIDTHGRVRRMSPSARLPALCSQSASLSTPKSDDTAPTWRTSIRTGNNATIVGYRDKLSFRFLGLKYAPKPDRFGYSQYRAPGGTNISALAYGPQCIQSGCTAQTCSEDCLFLNVWTPYLPSDKRFPSKKKAVMLWIHGGGFTSGSGTDTTFDGGNLASRGDVVVVTINYRLSTLGFLALDNTTIRGNYGISDQVAALDWVQAHIEDFGGDKDRILVFGQSAGAASVRALLASPKARGKFSRVILQSDPQGAQYASTFSRYLTIPAATNLTQALLSELGCTEPDKITCLQAQDPLRLVGERNGSYTGTVARYPVVDGTYLTSDQLQLNEDAPRTDVALMTGNMHDDGAPFSKFSTSGNASTALTEQGFDAAGILGSSRFPFPQGTNVTIDVFNLTARVTTDAEFRCLAQSTAIVGSENDIFPVVYAYEFDRAYQIIEWSPNPPTCVAPPTSARQYGDTRQPYFKCHSGELYYVFGTLVRQGRPPRDQDDIPFSQFIVDTWTAFARTTNPNPSKDFLAARGFMNTSTVAEQSDWWEPVRSEKSLLRILDTWPRNEQFREVEQCDVLKFPLDYYSQ